MVKVFTFHVAFSGKWLLFTGLGMFSLMLGTCDMERKETRGGTSAALPITVDYSFHIRPILSDKCFACHGPDNNKREAGLRLDTKEGAYKALADNPTGHALVPGNLDKSEVYARIMAEDETQRMPPVASNLTLTDYEKKLIARWIQQGAVYKPHWAFTVPKKPQIPKEKGTPWGANEIDRFVLDKMQGAGLRPNPVAEKSQLLRRLSLDLTGLPPNERQMDQFLKDSSPNAYETLVDTLLASPAYGERMAMQWMDVARYSDSYGYQDDDYRSQWPWRDWVIHAFNENMPYDRFVTWQLAGDLLPQPTKEQILATAFNRNHKITEEGGVIDEEYRVAYVLDKTNTYSKGILGITLECAQCHDHKYDPFTQKSYYQMSAFFNNTSEKGLEGLVNTTPSKTPRLTISPADLKNVLKFINDEGENAEMGVSVMDERDSIRPTYILDRGVYDAHKERVSPGTPQSILPFDSLKYAPNRLGLAQWTFSNDNPLTARVFVNQVWAMVFGRGIVHTVSDFGNQGELPSHPELLDWLAVDFREHGWDIKRLMKQLVMSATYRQSSKITAESYQIDPENVYLARSKRLRLPAETIRDQVLFSSGLLQREIGGPSVKIYQPDNIWEITSPGRGALAYYVQDHGKKLYRRGLYTFFKRTLPPPSMLIFDASSRDMCELTRQRTNTPLQALVMMNDPTVLEAARVLSGRLFTEFPKATAKERIRVAMRRILCREPTENELGILEKYRMEELARFKRKPTAAKAYLQVGEYPDDAKVPAEEHAALMSVVDAVYNLEEGITRI